MRVLELGPYPPPWGGVQANLVAIREHLHSHGVCCAVINITRHRKEDADGVYYPRTAWGLLRLLFRLEYDVVHLHLGGDLTPRLLALCLGCNLVPGKKTVLTFHSGGYPSSAAGQTARPATLRGFVLRRFDALIAVNPEIVALFRRFGAPAARIHLILPHALLDSEGAGDFPAGMHAFFESHGPVLITVGLLEPEYDLPLQVSVLGKVRERFPNAGLLIAGSGSLKDELKRTITLTPWRDHILLAGDVPHPAALGAIARSDVMLRTTHYDGDSVAVREALHVGTPVVASDNGMRPEGVRLVPSRDAAALLRAIGEALEQGVKRPLPQAGRENVQAVLNLYRELTPGPPQANPG